LKIKEIYDYLVELGIEKDPRGEEEVKASLDREKKKYDELKAEDKQEFDRERLTNPYADTRILCGDPEKRLKVCWSGSTLRLVKSSLPIV
jgi:hypothetical protein